MMALTRETTALFLCTGIMSKTNKQYDQDVFDWKMERTLMSPTPEELECDHCKETSIYVDHFDTSYRHANMEPNLIPLCIDCYTEFIVVPMDDQWADYYSGLL
jgi:23S rRNA G2069 N7-methylase RlmK/C1962 C5-methylase RlmI